MEPVKIINITLDIFCILVDMLIMLHILTVDYKKDKMNRLFVIFLLCNLLTLVMDIGISLWNGNGIKAFHLPLQIAHFITFGLGPVFLIAFTYYIITLFSKKTKIKRAVTYAAYAAVAVCILDLLFCLVNPFTQMYYYMDASNSYHRQSFFWLSQVFSFICIALNTGIIIAHRKTVKRYELFFLLSYVILPALTLAAHMILFGFSVMNHSISFMILIYYVGIQSDQAKQLKQKELELTNARVDIMLSQIRPHFLCNTLTTIENLCRKDGYQAAELVNNFSSYLRNNMESLNQKELVSFSRELENIKLYLEIEKMRFKERLNDVFDLNVIDFSLPILTVQPLVENAVQHGTTKRREGGTVKIETRPVSDGVEIIVTDDGVGFDLSHIGDDGRNHIGIENVRNRLAAQCGGTLSIVSSRAKGTTAVIFIPVKREEHI